MLYFYFSRSGGVGIIVDPAQSVGEEVAVFEREVTVGEIGIEKATKTARKPRTKRLKR
jgi:hypothetical protein